MAKKNKYNIATRSTNNCGKPIIKTYTVSGETPENAIETFISGLFKKSKKEELDVERKGNVLKIGKGKGKVTMTILGAVLTEQGELEYKKAIKEKIPFGKNKKKKK